MRVIRIRTPDQLRELALAAKNDRTRHSINAFAAVWSGMLKNNPDATIPYTVTLELTRGAKLTHTDTRTNRVTDFGPIYVGAARDIASRLEGEQ